MADPTQGQDPSMEDILASIRRIIDEDERKVPGTPATGADISGEDDDDVLELVEAIDDEPEEIEAEIWHGDDEVMPEDAEVVTPNPRSEPDPTPADEWQPAAPSQPFRTQEPQPGAAQAAAPAARHEDEMTASNDERLVSEAAYASAAAALGSLARASERDPLDGIQRGRPVEELVMELLKPMLRDWLDQNLPTIVERVVEREVRFLSRRMEGDDRA